MAFGRGVGWGGVGSAPVTSLQQGILTSFCPLVWTLIGLFSFQGAYILFTILTVLLANGTIPILSNTQSAVSDLFFCRSKNYYFHSLCNHFVTPEIRAHSLADYPTPQFKSSPHPRISFQVCRRNLPSGMTYSRLSCWQFRGFNKRYGRPGPLASMADCRHQICGQLSYCV